MNIVAPSPNHAGVFLAEQNCFYHHLMDRQSEKTVWGDLGLNTLHEFAPRELAVMT